MKKNIYIYIFLILVLILYNSSINTNNELDIINTSIYDNENILSINIIDDNEKFIFSEEKNNNYFILRKFNSKKEILIDKKFYLNNIIKKTYSQIFNIKKLTHGYIIYGKKINKKSHTKNETAWIKVINDAGSLKWQINNLNNNSNFLQEIVEVNDNSLILALQIYTDAKTYVSIIKLDNSGNLLWERKLDAYKKTYISDIEYTKDQKIIISGSIVDKEKFVNGIPKSLVVQLNFEGDIKWEKIFKKNGINDITEIEVINDKDYLVAGTNLFLNTKKDSFSKNKEFIWISKINSKGNILWDKKINESNQTNNMLLQLNSLNDKSFAIIYKEKTNLESNIYLLKINQNGNIIEKKLLLNQKKQENNYIWDFYEINGNYFLKGINSKTSYVNSWNEKNSKDWIIKFDEKFNKKWIKEIPKYIN